MASAEKGASRAEVVVGIDGSRSTVPAVAWAHAEAERLGVALVVVHAFTVPALPSVAGPLQTPQQRKAARAEAGATLRAAVDPIRAASGSTGDVTAELIEGPAAEALVRRTAHARLLVLGAHHGLVPRQRLGSVLGTCLRDA